MYECLRNKIVMNPDENDILKNFLSKHSLLNTNLYTMLQVISSSSFGEIVIS